MHKSRHETFQFLLTLGKEETSQSSLLAWSESRDIFLRYQEISFWSVNLFGLIDLVRFAIKPVKQVSNPYKQHEKHFCERWPTRNRRLGRNCASSKCQYHKIGCKTWRLSSSSPSPEGSQEGRGLKPYRRPIVPIMAVSVSLNEELTGLNLKYKIQLRGIKALLQLRLDWPNHSIALQSFSKSALAYWQLPTKWTQSSNF